MTERKISRRSFITTSAMFGVAMALDWSKINALAANKEMKRGQPLTWDMFKMNCGMKDKLFIIC